MCEDTYTRLKKKLVFPVIEKTWATEQSAVLTTTKSQEAEVELCGDGRCDSPGASCINGAQALKFGARYVSRTCRDV